MAKEDKHHCISKEDLIKKTQRNIDEFGLQVIMVSATNYFPPFVYSIGLVQTYNHPEVICFGLPKNLGHTIINDIAQLIKNGETIEPGKIYTNIFKDSKAIFLEVDNRNLGNYFGAAFNYYGDKSFDALQVVWTDRKDRFPWEENFEKEFLYQQPLLDRNADFKFLEPKNRAAVTTRQWLEEQKPILHVAHDTDGYWQFLTGDQEDDDIRMVGLGCIIEQDHTLNEIFDLDYGEEAEREFVGGKWTRNKTEDDDE